MSKIANLICSILSSDYFYNLCFNWTGYNYFRAGYNFNFFNSLTGRLNANTISISRYILVLFIVCFLSFCSFSQANNLQNNSSYNNSPEQPEQPVQLENLEKLEELEKLEKLRRTKLEKLILACKTLDISKVNTLIEQDKIALTDLEYKELKCILSLAIINSKKSKLNKALKYLGVFLATGSASLLLAKLGLQTYLISKTNNPKQIKLKLQLQLEKISKLLGGSAFISLTCFGFIEYLNFLSNRSKENKYQDFKLISNQLKFCLQAS